MAILQNFALTTIVAACVGISVSGAGPIIGIGWDRSPDSYVNVYQPPYSNEKIGISAFTWWIANEWVSRERPLKLTAQLRYARWRQEQEVVNSGMLFLPENLRSLELAFCLTGVVSEGSRTTVFLAPTIENASEETLKPNDFKTSLGVLHRYELGQSSIGVGVAWLRTFGRSHVLPLLEVSWANKRNVIGAKLCHCSLTIIKFLGIGGHKLV